MTSVVDHMAQPWLGHEPTDRPAKPRRYVDKPEFLSYGSISDVDVRTEVDGYSIELAREVIVYVGEVA